MLAPGEPGLLDRIAPAFRELDYLLPNGEQVLALTGAEQLEDGCRALLERVADRLGSDHGAFDLAAVEEIVT